MAISQTMSNPSDWLFQPYQHDFSQINQTFQTNSPTTTFFAANGSSSSNNNNNNNNNNSNNNNNLIPEQGRVAKPARRRSRASRRTPTTLLNTDTANFRAMVQHFTGGPAARQLLIPSRGGAAASYMDRVAAGGGFHVQYPQQQQNMFVMDGVHGGGVGVPPQAAAGSGNRINYENFMV
ncbi:VQ motif-containing protein 22-like [Salvia splendens]|uniref:VQ motif-containing protein 22-like n=1 Tax=Salvia splendens TaxID=180675 RepID=UPI001C26F764|nr:VQ motif-containing protein 22-like [Salvia splendens]